VECVRIRRRNEVRSVAAEDLGTRILKLLHHYRGRENAVTARFIASVVGTNERTVRQVISDLRRLGHPIASTPNPPWGFYMPADRSEAEECSRHLWSRAREIAEVARAFDHAAGGLGVKRERVEQVRMVFGEEEAV